MNFKNIDLGIG
jgi:hypothetical protein